MTLSTPRTRPLSLAGLRGFEATARHLSITKAARELHLTQSSMSRQIQALEDELGFPLFVRTTRSLALTRGGETLLRVLGPALQDIDGIVTKLRTELAEPRLVLTTFNSFASLWLIPRLVDFSAQYPDIEYRVVASEQRLDLEREGIDVALRYGSNAEIPPDALVLAPETVTPVCSPAFLREHRLREPADLAHVPWLRQERVQNPQLGKLTWEAWTTAAGVAGLQPGHERWFTFADQTIWAALRGQGITLGRRLLVDDLLANGDLVAPFPIVATIDRYYYVLVARGAAGRAEVAAFMRWLKPYATAGAAWPAAPTNTAATREDNG